jgi:hypothetical protein
MASLEFKQITSPYLATDSALNTLLPSVSAVKPVQIDYAHKYLLCRDGATYGILVK